MVKKLELIIIALGGLSFAEMLKHINIGLQTLVLLATLIGIIFRIYYEHKKQKL